jgi:AraC-like DNA-binding protein
MWMRFSSNQMPSEMRRDAVEAAFGAHVQGSVDFLGKEHVAVDMTLRSVASVHIAALDVSPVQLVTPSDEDGVLYLSITSNGGGVIDATGEMRTVKAGDVNVMRRDRRCTTMVLEHSNILSIAISRAQLLPRLSSIDNLNAPHMHSMAAARMLESYATTLVREEGEIDADAQALFASHLVDLAALILGARRDDAESAKKGGVRAARRQAIKADIAAHLDLPELSLDWIAKRHRVSGVYVRSLFYDEGTSFTDYVLNQRLDHVRMLLPRPYLAHHTIATLALMAGFGDISWFNQAFRRRFGMTPSDVRSAQG